MMKWRRVAPVAIAMSGLLLAACSSNPTTSSTAQSAKRSSSCSSPKTVYLFPYGRGVEVGESATWKALSLNDGLHTATIAEDRLVEAVVPYSTSWVVTDLHIDATGAKRLSRLAKSMALKLADASNPSVLSARACFTGLDEVTVLHVGVVTGPIAVTAIRLTNGMEMVTPTTLQPGGVIFVVLDRGSLDNQVYQGGFAGNLNWYAVRIGGAVSGSGSSTDMMQVYRVQMLHYANVGNKEVFEFGLPPVIMAGVYQLALLTPQAVSATGPRNMGILNGAATGDFTFQVP